MLCKEKRGREKSNSREENGWSIAGMMANTCVPGSFVCINCKHYVIFYLLWPWTLLFRITYNNKGAF